MPKKTDIKIMLAAAFGVLLAGVVMSQGRNIGLIAMAHDGFDS